MSPQPVGFDRNIASGTSLSALKNSVFDKVTDSVEFRRFVAGTPANPDSRGHGSQPGHVLGKYSDAVRDFCSLNFVYHLLESKQCVKGSVG
jgi:hypothetical protein